MRIVKKSDKVTEVFFNGKDNDEIKVRFYVEDSRIALVYPEGEILFTTSMKDIVKETIAEDERDLFEELLRQSFVGSDNVATTEANA